jgi:sugar phosphate permease
VAGLIANFGVLIFFFSYREHEPSSQSSSHLQPAAGKPQGLSQIMRNRNVLLVSIAGAIMIIGQYTLTIYIVFYLNEELGVPLLEASTFLAVAHFSGAFGRIVWGIASDRLYGGSRRRVLVHSGMLSVGLTLVIAALVRGTPVTLLYFLIALYGFAVVGWTGMWVALLSELAGRNRSGTALGVGMTFVQVGKVGGPPLLGLLHDLTGTYRFSWLALSVIIAIATFIFYLAREMRVD